MHVTNGNMVLQALKACSASFLQCKHEAVVLLCTHACWQVQHALLASLARHAIVVGGFSHCVETQGQAYQYGLQRIPLSLLTALAVCSWLSHTACTDDLGAPRQNNQ